MFDFTDFTEMFAVNVINAHDTPEGPRYYDFADLSGEYVLTLCADEMDHFMDVATGHFAPYGDTPTGRHYNNFINTYYVR